MAVEFCKSAKNRDDGVISYYEVEVDGALAKKLARPQGRYTTLETRAVVTGRTDDYGRVTEALGACIREYCKGADKIMVVGLGNPDLTADALGDRVFKRLIITRHLNPDKIGRASCRERVLAGV